VSAQAVSNTSIINVFLFLSVLRVPFTMDRVVGTVIVHVAPVSAQMRTTV